ncbi:MAG: hypothetical protein AAFQ42_05785 [Pseudomonadota bacterium]
MAQTPGQVKVSKSSQNIQVACEKAGYQPAQVVLNSEFEAMTAGNLLVGGVIGLAVDAGTGAMNKYDGVVTVPLQPLNGAAPARTPSTTTPSSTSPTS